jgi:hypothetical protein
MILEDSEPHGPNFLSGGIKGGHHALIGDVVRLGHRRNVGGNFVVRGAVALKVYAGEAPA